MSRTDAAINFNWTSPLPAPVSTASYAVRWHGFLKPTVSQTAKLRLTASDYASLQVDGNVVAECYPIKPVASGTVYLDQDTLYELEIAYNRYQGPAYILLEWAGDQSLTFSAVPSTNLMSAPWNVAFLPYTAVSATTCATASTCYGPGLTVVTGGSPSLFYIQTRDAYGNERTTGSDTILSRIVMLTARTQYGTVSYMSQGEYQSLSTLALPGGVGTTVISLATGV